MKREFEKDFDMKLPSEQFVEHMFENIFSRSAGIKEIDFHKNRKDNPGILHEFLQCVETIDLLKERLRSSNPQKKKIALQINGHFRSFEVRRILWSDFVAKNPDIDIFIHTWSTTGIRSREKWIDESGSLSIDVKDITNTLKPKSILVENNEDLLDHFAISTLFPNIMTYMNRGVSPFLVKDDFTKFIMSQLYSTKMVNGLRKRHQLVTKKEYDIVFRLRADAFPLMDFSILDNIEVPQDAIFANMRGQRFPHRPLSGCSACNYEYPSRSHKLHSNYMSDVFYYSSPKVMDIAAGIFDNVGEILYQFQEHNNRMDMDGHRIHNANHNIRIVLNDGLSESIYKCFYPEVLLSHTLKDYWVLTDISRCKVVLNTAIKVK